MSKYKKPPFLKVISGEGKKSGENKRVFPNLEVISGTLDQDSDSREGSNFIADFLFHTLDEINNDINLIASILKELSEEKSLSLIALKHEILRLESIKFKVKQSITKSRELLKDDRLLKFLDREDVSTALAQLDELDQQLNKLIEKFPEFHPDL